METVDGGETRRAAEDVTALAAEDIAVARSGRLILENVTFAAPAGCFMTLRGPNGSGKTTLLRALAGLAPPLRGALRAGGAALAKDADGYREQILFAGHLDAVKPSLTLSENLTFWLRFYGGEAKAADRAAWRALERFGLEELADAPAGRCSAGQKRRLGLARLAAVERRIWLLDEPAVSLDAASVDALTTLIAEHCAAGGVTIAATHQDLEPSATSGVGVERLEMDAFTPGRVARIDGQGEAGRGGAGGGAASDDPFLWAED